MDMSEGAHWGTVFVVDDDGPVLELLRTLIEADGFKVQSWSSAETFLADFRSSEGGCLVLDLDLPGSMNGLDLAEWLQERQVRLPIIFVSGRGDLLTSGRAKDIDAFGYFSKPFDNQLLLACIRRGMSRTIA